MADCSQRFHIDSSEKGFYACSICECVPGVHLYFVHCPLVEDELICIDCCQNEFHKEETLKKLKDTTESDITRAEVDAICKKCGNRNVGDKAEEAI